MSLLLICDKCMLQMIKKKKNTERREGRFGLARDKKQTIPAVKLPLKYMNINTTYSASSSVKSAGQNSYLKLYYTM